MFIFLLDFFFVRAQLAHTTVSFSFDDDEGEQTDTGLTTTEVIKASRVPGLESFGQYW